jgi:hypothetical protein
MGRALHASLWLRALSMATLLVGPLACGQAAPAVQPQTVVDVLHQMSDEADVIFAGEVLAVRRPNDGVVEVAFRVDQAIRGCTTGSTYILREWAGLWTGDNQRYRVGQRLLMLLHAPSAAGMSSPVGGLDGAIPIRQGGLATPMSNVVTPLQPPFVDLRWLGVRLTRAVSYRSEAARAAKPNGLPTRTDVQQQTMSMAAPGLTTAVAPLTLMGDSSSSSPGSVPAQQASVDAVIGMLTAWQKAPHVAP